MAEFAAAGMLGFLSVCLVVYAVRFWERGAVDVAGLTILCGMVGAFLWIGGHGLRRARTWTVAAKVSGAVMFLIGLTTVVTGYHTEGGGQSKMWRKVDRNTDLHLIVIGLVLVGSAHLIEARLKSKRAEQGGRANAGERAPKIARP